MKKTMMTAAGIVAAVSMAAAAGMVVGAKNGKAMRRAAAEAADTMQEAGRKFGRMVKKMN